MVRARLYSLLVIFLFSFLSVCLSFYFLSIVFPVCLSVCLSFTYLSIFFPVCLSVCLSLTYLSIFFPACLSVFLLSFLPLSQSQCLLEFYLKSLAHFCTFFILMFLFSSICLLNSYFSPSMFQCFNQLLSESFSLSFFFLSLCLRVATPQRLEMSGPVGALHRQKMR
jgi:hypothetical protein